MGVIAPTLSITSNASTASSDAGPLSIALSLSATDSLSVDQVAAKIIDVSGTHALLWDASDYAATASAGTDGGFVYLKNVHATVNIMIGIANENLSSDDETDRLMTLLPGEFAFLPWDMTQDLYVDANGSGTNGLETWLFIRTNTV